MDIDDLCKKDLLSMEKKLGVSMILYSLTKNSSHYDFSMINHRVKQDVVNIPNLILELVFLILAIQVRDI